MSARSPNEHGPPSRFPCDRFLYTYPGLTPNSSNAQKIGHSKGMANATIRLRLMVTRLFYEYLIEEDLRKDNPVGRGRYTRGANFANAGGLVLGEGSSCLYVEQL